MADTGITQSEGHPSVALSAARLSAEGNAEQISRLKARSRSAFQVEQRSNLLPCQELLNQHLPYYVYGQ